MNEQRDGFEEVEDVIHRARLLLTEQCSRRLASRFPHARTFEFALELLEGRDAEPELLRLILL